MPKTVIRLRTKEFMKATIDADLGTVTEMAAKIGVSYTQLYRTTLPVDHPNYNAPGTAFIAGVMSAFDAPFEQFFFLEKNLRGHKSEVS
ncbi:hypothetical protein [Terribacillus sp. DMT04]|uniref:hypothetical protein n=1 Tax=Terribacillus sp. DMT04 TaxID=2850441 RepID=UPI001C2C65DE|nr:hypothetical protein [Terribacillus sp. DMT04]QXE02791.1 hypothetical protein KS242_06320 [Terribacillus sp. DMT04]